MIRYLLAAITVVACAPSSLSQVTAPMDASPLPPELVAAQRQLLSKHFVSAKTAFATYLAGHPGNIDAQVGAADADLALHQYEAAELEYRKVVAAQPERWLAHKNLVIVEAALERWDEFDRERTVLRDARDRGAPGISARESDVIDAFDIRGEHWIVREYYEPVGRSLTRYNFELFSADGKVREYVSLESAKASEQAAAVGGTVQVGRPAPAADNVKDFTLNFYTGKVHGTITRYPGDEPPYETVRAAVRRWLLSTKPVASR